MAGRDLKQFINSSRTTRTQSVARIRSAHGKKYKEVDYDALQAEMQRHKESNSKLLDKLEKVQRTASAGRSRATLAQRKAKWIREAEKYNKDCAARTADMETFISSLAAQSVAGAVVKGTGIDDIPMAYDEAARRRREFGQSLLRSVLDARAVVTTIQSGGNRAGLAQTGAERLLVQLREDVDRHGAHLAEEAQAVAEEVREGPTRAVVADGRDDVLEALEASGLPVAAIRDPGVREQCVAEVRELDARFAARVKTLEEDYSDVVAADSHGWDEAAHFHFKKVLDSADRHTARWHDAFVAQLQQEIEPSPSRASIVAHERWVGSRKIFLDLRRNLRTTWHRARVELAEEIASACRQADALEEQHMARRGEAARLADLRARLQTRLEGWRDRKVLEEATSARQAEIEQEAREEAAAESARQEQLLREVQNIRLQQHHETAMIGQRREEQLLANEQELEGMMQREQARINEERVLYREEARRQKLKEAREEARQREAAALRRQECLEALAATVAVTAKSDPTRVAQATEAWRTRVDEGREGAGLFRVHGYDDKTIMADQRFKVHMALRSAGLHNTAYGRQAIAAARPLQEPRRDTIATRNSAT